ncbi:MAG: O-antigen ligase family protein [Phycisphaerae bacterium]|nr:O-antigen ligase family protein [Phycisphaerae bacterium]
MTAAILVITVFVLLSVLVVQPKLAALLSWPIILVYPHLYLFYESPLPWNMGYDDLFICGAFLIVLVRRNLLQGVPLRIGLSVLGAGTYVLIWAVAHFSGWSMMPELEPVDVVKPILKAVIFFLFTFVLVHCIDDVRDLRRALVAVIASFTAAAITVILHEKFPDQMVIFTGGKTELYQLWWGRAPRAVGSLVNPNTGAIVLGMTIVLSMRLATVSRSLVRKITLLVCVALMLAAMVLTESRTGALATGATLGVMFVFSRSRWLSGGVVLGLFGLIVLDPGLFLAFWERISETYNPAAGGELGGSLQARLDTWAEYWKSATPQVWVFGQGLIVPTTRIGFHPHSTYVSALFVHGIAGLIWFLAFFGVIIVRAVRVIRARVEPLQSICTGVLWGLMVWFIGGLTLDLLSTFHPRYLYFFFAVVVERSYALLKARQPVTDSVPAQVSRRFGPPAAGRLPRPATAFFGSTNRQA